MTAEQITAAWSLIVTVGVGVGVIVALIKGMQFLFQMTPVSKLETRVSKIEDHDKNDNEKLKEIEQRIDRLEAKLSMTDDKMDKINEGIQRLGKSQILLLRHFATGNGQKEMAAEADDLTAYFIDRR